MKMRNKKSRYHSGFTIVELIVVIVVIGVLASISIVSYGAWRHSATAAKVKSDLNGVISAMDSYRTFNNAYSTTVPTSVVASSGVVLVGGSSDGSTYCVDGTSTDDATITYYVASEVKAQGPLSGTCGTRPSITAPGVPAGLAVASFTASTVSLTWTRSSNAVTYNLQCASDAGFVNGLQSATVTDPTASGAVAGLSGLNSYYCRISATNANSTSAWSANVSTSTRQYTCADSSQYGTYPVCYAYDSLPIAASIEGYWSTPPSGYLLEDGSAVSRTTYSDLFAAIGTSYGAGDGSTTFNVPDSRGRLTVNISAADAEFNTIGEKYGEKTHIVSQAEMPAHSHQQYVTANTGGVAIRKDFSADAAGGIYPQGINTGSNGGGAARNNIQPSIAKVFAIKYRPSTGVNSQLAAGTSLDGYWSSAPTGYLAEDGSAVLRASYPDLFASIGTTYGAGNGTTTFNLPDSRGRTAVNLNASDTQFATMGLKYGEKTHVETIAEMPAHAHDQVVTANTGGPAIRTDYAADGAGGTYDQGVQTGGAGSGQAQNVIQPSIVKLSVIKTSAATGALTDLGVTTGSSVSGYWSSAPAGYLIENGAAVSRTTYANLFAVVGTTYGAGDGSTTFNLPDSRGRASVNLSSLDAEFNTVGEKYGEKAHTLTINEMPAHVHAQVVTANTGGSAIRDDYKADTSGVPYGQGQGTGNNGGGVAFNIIQPSIVALFAIKY
jgi:prepilin-type N-terminal cleavage/methylation domain-containing protein